jgi:regulator of cell morphogenesis and NO signaling
LDLLADYVEKTHHRYVEEKTPILQFLDKLCKVHGGGHPELFEIRDLFFASAGSGRTSEKRRTHSFPIHQKYGESQIDGTAIPQPPFGTVENPVNMMKHEHTVEGERLRKIAELTNEYTPPADACNTYKVTFAMLQDFENDLHKYSFENNILFPKSIELEKRIFSRTLSIKTKYMTPKKLWTWLAAVIIGSFAVLIFLAWRFTEKFRPFRIKW